MRITKANWAKSVNAAMPIPREIKKVKSLNPRNAYQMKLEREYNSGTSVRQPERLKMYAELARKKKCKKLGIKSLNGNKLIPIIADSQCPASHLAFLNESYIKLCVHKDEFFRFEPFVKPVELAA